MTLRAQGDDSRGEPARRAHAATPPTCEQAAAAPIPGREQLHALLYGRRAEIADRWYGAIARTSFTPRRAVEVRAELEALITRAIDLLLSEPAALAQASEIGVALAELHYVRPAALRGTLTVLGRELVVGLAPETVVALHPRLVELLGGLAAGYYERSRVMTLEEQDQIRRALFVSRQEAEAAEEARLVAEAAVRVRTEVLNAAAHDLRLPVTTIIGHADLLRMHLQRQTLPTVEWIAARAEAIRGAAISIRTMAEELLDVAHLQAGQTLELRLEAVDIGALVQEVARPRIDSTTGSAPVLVDAPPGLLVQGDRARLARVIDNLLGNAIKYGREGTPVQVEVRPHAQGVSVTVRDQGVGIPAGELPRLFTPFFRASTARGIPGIGIGLSGAKAIVEQHGGRISVDSVLDQGTTVTIILPAAPAPAGEGEPVSAGRIESASAGENPTPAS